MAKRQRLGVAVAALLLGTACRGGGDGKASAASSAEVRPFSEMQTGEITFEPDGVHPGRVLAHVHTKQDMICAFVWGETEALGRFNNSLSMNGTGISDHVVGLPGAEAGTTYHYIVEGAAKDGTLYRSRMATFVAPRGESAPADPNEPAGPNLAQTGQVTAVSSEYDASFAGTKANDGDLGTEWSSKGDGNRATITVDLGAPKKVVALEFISRSMGDGTAVTKTYRVVVDDKATYGPYAAGNPVRHNAQAVDFTGRVLRFEVVDSTGGNTGAAEVRAFGPPA